jgi:hypothetical protein
MRLTKLSRSPQSKGGAKYGANENGVWSTTPTEMHDAQSTFWVCRRMDIVKDETFTDGRQTQKLECLAYSYNFVQNKTYIVWQRQFRS